ncbi:unnamed protein product [Penicillium nalgiovense]|uniref:F-box domain-containing protein n=1 Tax=Penicillium nalgiovense TaxID=60175 RepID=A0A9W4ITD0_PENNA|nr:unnamed protein product [Penicillium nalgiovense]CAG7941758.1 unnamed protein product [Penicillium nalgiovense]CAG7944788.1 unnamed protein product [Penicillium nalgiovense]CAG7946395.1 unnamed protein product [Penicillium nalgiovense]CAG7962479.1 unnamed protein product [Penicillium nalgiovense]
MQFLLFPSLGTFGMIPVEIRLMIWEYLFYTIRTQPVRYTFHRESPLSILCTSRDLYNEISSHLFSNSVQHVTLNPEYNEQERMIIQFKFRAKEIKWALRNREDAERHFQNFPHSKMTMIVHINRPNPTDPGQLVLLWQKTNALADLLIPITRANIKLAANGPWRSPNPPASWGSDRDLFYQMGGLQESIPFGPKYRPDYDIIMLPFLRLGLWVEDPISVPTMSDEEFNILRRCLFSLFDQTGIEHRLEKFLSMTKDTAVHEIESTIIETNLFLETRLDELPGITARFLRLERYKNWFEDGEIWESLYEAQLEKQLSTCPQVITDIDLLLDRLSTRYVVLILLHHAICSPRSNLYGGLGRFDDSRIYTTWDSEMWPERFPNGVPQLSDVQTCLLRFWRPGIDLFGKFLAYSKWLGGRGPRKLDGHLYTV